MKTLSLVLVCVLGCAPFALAEWRGVIDDPDGYVNVRARPSAEAPVVAKVKTGERFTFEREEEDDQTEWCKVQLFSGKSGWMHGSRIRFFYDENDLPVTEKDPAGPSEIDETAQRLGFDYAAETRRAARGDAPALQRFFQLAQEADGAAAESITGVPTVVYHLLGDEKFARFLAVQSLAVQGMVRNIIVRDGPLRPTTLYLQRHFPATTKILFRREIVGWTSPNERFAIRKVFSKEFDLTRAKIVRAELIEEKTGRVLCDLTRDDIGTGAEREGAVLWSPDSQRFAYLSSDLTPGEGNLFSTPRPPLQKKQTAIYQIAEDTFRRVDLNLDEIPGRESDTELKDAIPGHEYIEPVRWEKPNLLVLKRHDYYQKLAPTDLDGVKFESIHDLGRSYEIKAEISPEGKATVVWKRQEEE